MLPSNQAEDCVRRLASELEALQDNAAAWPQKTGLAGRCVRVCVILGGIGAPKRMISWGDDRTTSYVAPSVVVSSQLVHDTLVPGLSLD